MISFDFPAVSLDCLESRPETPFSVIHHLHLSEKWTINKNNNKKENIFLISNPPSASLWKMNYAHLDNKWLTKKIKPLWKRNNQPDSKDDKVFFFSSNPIGCISYLSRSDFIIERNSSKSISPFPSASISLWIWSTSASDGFSLHWKYVKK